jgi:membrane-bound serine protease (ClpP class)
MNVRDRILVGLALLAALFLSSRLPAQTTAPAAGSPGLTVSQAQPPSASALSVPASSGTAPTTTYSANPRAAVIVLDGMIDDFAKNLIEKRVAEARQLGVGTVILQIDTYGGLVTSGLDISRFLKRLDDLRVIALVDEKAISAGAMIALACDAIYMEPASLIGDVGVIMAGQTIEGDTERAKGESPVLADFQDSAARNGHDATLVLSMVQLIRTAHFIENIATGETRIVETGEFESLTAGDSPAWRAVPGVPNPLDSEKTLLTLGDELALRVGLSEGTVGSAEELAKQQGLIVVQTFSPSAGERLVGWLSSGTVRGLVLTLLVLALIYGVKLPGTGVTEAAIVVLLGVLFTGPLLTGLAEWYEVLMVLVGLALVAVEIFVLPGFGVAGISGLALMLSGLVMTFLPPFFPSQLPPMTGVAIPDISRALLLVLGSTVGAMALWIAAAGSLPKLPMFNKLILTQAVGTSDPIERDRQVWPPVGTAGVAQTDLRPGGQALFSRGPGTEMVDVVCDRGFIRAGTPLVVIEVHGNRIVVRTDADPSGATHT